uniref:Regulatory protein E2 n=1 Tax=Human papillomavirus TaxID=10566 RepID=A0A385PHI9_9PAPI|nr:MAG: E2 protein [Human papillomavirus]
MNQADLTSRFDALQDRLMNLYESAPKTIEAQIDIWETIRKEYVLYYYGRKEGYKNFGLQPLPVLSVSEYKAKEAIQQVLLLKSLRDSPYGREEWTLTDTSAELTHTQPRNAFKKGPYTVEVFFDNDPKNSFPYTNWKWLYIQDEQENWYKTPGLADVNGLYYEDNHGDKNYFVIFASDAQTYGTTGEWTVKFNNEYMSSVPASTSQDLLSGSLQGSSKGFVSSSRDTVSHPQTPRRKEAEEGGASSTTASPPSVRRRRRGPQQGERTTTRTKRRRLEEDISSTSPEQVGSGTDLVPRRGLKRLERLKAEARDPFVILVTGAANSLKCWRFRIKKSQASFLCVSTVFTWAGIHADACNQNHKMLIAFSSSIQRDIFIRTVTFPKGSRYTLGNLNSL